MDAELKSLFDELFARQAVIYQKLSEIENKLNGRTSIRSTESYLHDLRDKAEAIQRVVR